MHDRFTRYIREASQSSSLELSSLFTRGRFFFSRAVRGRCETPLNPLLLRSCIRLCACGCVLLRGCAYLPTSFSTRQGARRRWWPAEVITLSRPWLLASSIDSSCSTLLKQFHRIAAFIRRHFTLVISPLMLLVSRSAYTISGFFLSDFCIVRK